MFIEHRTYSLQTGKTRQYFDALGKRGYELQAEMAPCLGYYASEAGDLFQVVSLWRWNSFEERQEKRAKLYQNRDWVERIDRVSPMVQKIETKLLVPAPIWPGA